MGSRELEVRAECHEALALTAPTQELMVGSVKGEILMGLIRASRHYFLSNIS
jgi:hypothetical protein